MAMRLWIYSAGWVYYPTPGSDLEVRVRFAERSDGRLEAVDVWVSRAVGISASALRTIPLAKIEAAVNLPEAAEAIRSKMNEEWALPEAKVIAFRNSVAPTGPAELDLSVWAAPLARLDVPTSRKKPDEFYRRVAEAYQTLAGMDRRPAVILAKTNRVPVTTVHRWVKEARSRGFLAPARRLSPRQGQSETGEGQKAQ
jgi:hypothetical protein